MLFLAQCRQTNDTTAVTPVSNTTTTSSTAKVDAINWQPDFNTALAKSSEASKPVLVDFFATWCGYCKRLDAETFTDADLAAYMNETFVPVKVDTDKQTELSRKYNIAALPTTVILDTNGTELGRIQGFRDAKAYHEEIASIIKPSAN